MTAHRMTPARKAALKKAQAASARKRRGTGKGKLAAAHRQIGSNSGGVRGHLRRHGGTYATYGVAAALVAAAITDHSMRRKSRMVHTEFRSSRSLKPASSNRAVPRPIPNARPGMATPSFPSKKPKVQYQNLFGRRENMPKVNPRRPSRTNYTDRGLKHRPPVWREGY